jgi:uncharacterized membrane protein YcaP (DUF421 family)
MFQFGIPPIDLVIRAVTVFLFVLVLLRISGKRQIGQMGATEFVAILLISNAVQNAMNGGDNSLVGGLLLAAVLIAASWLISLLTYRSRLAQRLFEGAPTLVIHEGKIIKSALERERLTTNELRVLLREQGIHGFDEVHTAILEADGRLSVTRTAELGHPSR